MESAARRLPIVSKAHRAAGLAAAAMLALATIAAAPPSAGASSSASRGAGAGAAANSAPRPTAAQADIRPAAVSALPALPATWPSTSLEIGLTDSPNGAAALHASGAYKFRYQYLCGGVNTPTGDGWGDWNSPKGQFATYYVDESVAVGMTPTFIYYQLLQSKPGIDDLTAQKVDEKGADLENLKNTTTMKSYWADVRLMFQRLGAYSQTIVVDLEPDLWGYIQQASTGDSGATVSAAVASSGDADVAGLANNADGFAQAFIRLRDKYAPNVLLGYELSMWGTNTDPLEQNIPLNQIDALAARSTAFQQSLGASFDLVFTDPADRDADFDKIINGDGGASWWDSTDYDRFNQYVGDFVRGVGLRMVLWQIPLGNTKMRAMNDSWGHYQDNHVEWWFDDATGTHLAATVDSGVVAMLFGGGAGGTTSATDEQNDGTTNPPAIDGNTTLSYSSDDDGGYFRHQANAYYISGAMTLPGSGPVTTNTYHPVDPVRLLDTRIGNGLSGKFAAATPRAFQVTERGGPSNVPTGATAVTANVTIVKPSATSSVYLGPVGIAHPSTATISFNKGDITAYGSTIALSDAGTISGTYMASSGSSDLVIDVTGYFTPDDTGDTYNPLTPARLLDTRHANGLSTKFVAGVPQTFTVWGRGGVPTSATAVTGNLTVVNSTNSWAAYIGPDPLAAPGASTINFARGQIRANSLTVALSSSGTLSATFLSSGTNKTDLVFDVTGYYTAALTGSRYVPITPASPLDTRYGVGLNGKFSANAPRTFTVKGHAGIPDSASGVTGIVSVVNQSSSWAIFVGPNATSTPSTSALNFLKGDNCSNGVTVALSGSGTLSVTYMGTKGNTTNVVFVVTGYFVPTS
jgi:hypothetical protein